MSETDIHSITIDFNDLVEALKFNARNHVNNIVSDSNAFIRVVPPFEGNCKTSIEYEERGIEYPRNIEPKPLLLSPKKFIPDTMWHELIKLERRYKTGEMPDKKYKNLLKNVVKNIQSKTFDSTNLTKQAENNIKVTYKNI